MDENYLWQYVMQINPFAKREDVIEITELNEWDLLIIFKDGRKVLYDKFTKSFKYVYYDDIKELSEEQEKRELAYRIRVLMGRKWVTQEELAERTNTSQTMISRYVSGYTTPSAIMLRKIAKALGYSLDDFFDKNY